MKKQTGANYEIAVDGTPRSYRVDKQIAIDSARFLTTKNPGAKLTVRDLTTRDHSEISPQRNPKHTVAPRGVPRGRAIPALSWGAGRGRNRITNATGIMMVASAR
jgi:hypothetical protein